jgi:hypothetical protein
LIRADADGVLARKWEVCEVINSRGLLEIRAVFDSDRWRSAFLPEI